MLGLVGWPWAEMVVCLGGLLVLQGWAGRESPGGDSLFFASPKKSKQKKGDPQSGALRFASGNLRCARKAGVRANSPSAQTARGHDPAFLAHHRPSQDGWARVRIRVQELALMHEKCLWRNQHLHKMLVNL